MTSLELARLIACAVLDADEAALASTQPYELPTQAVLDTLHEHDAWFCKHGTGTLGETTHALMQPTPEQLDMFAEAQ